jgi:urea transport system substrate-binding protein
LAGHFAAWNYFQSIKTPENLKFVENFKNYCIAQELPGGNTRVTSDPMCWSYTGLYLWKEAVEKAGSFEVDKVIAALSDMENNSPGGMVKMHHNNHHLAKKVLIGEIRPNGQFEIIYETKDLVSPEPFSEYAKRDKK